ncbi:polysaccharide biosynthesis protein [Paraburkholderia sp. BL6669N2]|uniref:oligosaccharide flippase family protein n=1 Tax=Paraburkholderia sp. BL6669N2 TaxID=1938807 RepID=UPI000E23B3C7|nr:oligosaccharide flippase family protein [Paraburkholderia sp. BL6669N2]REG45620.1 polysaccharide biosynthesis protein [Paraburkholderia sp. BL6669N2]
MTMNIRRLPLFVIARACPAMSTLAIAYTVERMMGAATYGQFSLVFTAYLSAAAFFFGWISQGVARFSNGEDDLLSTGPEVFFVGWIASVTLILTCAGVVSFFWGPRSVVFLSAVAACAQGLHLLVVSIHQARFRINAYLRLEAIRAACIATCVILPTIYWAESFTDLVVGLTAGTLLEFAIVAVFFRKYVSFNKTATSEIDARLLEVLQYSWPIAIWLATSLAIPFMDRFVLGLISNKSTMGQYAYQYDIVFRSFTFILLPVTLVVQPSIFKAYSENDISLVKSLIRKGIILQSLLGGFLIVFLYAVIFHIGNFYGKGIHLDKGVFVTLSVAACCWQIALMCQKVLECKKMIMQMVALLFFLLSLRKPGSVNSSLPRIWHGGFLYWRVAKWSHVLRHIALFRAQGADDLLIFQRK